MAASDLYCSSFDNTCAKPSGGVRAIAQGGGLITFWLHSLTITTSAVLVGFLAACSVAGTGDMERMSFTTVDRGFQSGVRERKALVVKSEKEWRELWEMHSSFFAPAKPVPSIDFDKEMIVAVFAGEKRTGGYVIEITVIEEDRAKQQLRVVYRETKPPAGVMVTQVLTQPYCIVRLKKIDLPARFVNE